MFLRSMGNALWVLRLTGAPAWPGLLTNLDTKPGYRSGLPAHAGQRQQHTTNRIAAAASGAAVMRRILRMPAPSRRVGEKVFYAA